MGKTHFISLIEKKLSTLLNTLYCEEDIYMHPYRRCLSLKEWKQTYAKSIVDFSSGYRISVNQFSTLSNYAKRMNLEAEFDSIGFYQKSQESYDLFGDRNLEQLYAFLEMTHVSSSQIKSGSFLTLASKA